MGRLKKRPREEEAGVGEKMSWRFRESKTVTRNMDFGVRPSQVLVDGTSVSSSIKWGAHLAQGLASRRGSVNSSCCLVSKGALERESRLGLIQTPICSQCLTKEAWPDGPRRPPPAETFMVLSG